jgi:predicted Zn-dependent protease
MAAEVARSMTMMLPDNSWGYIQLAYSLRELKQIKEAWEILIPIADKFPEDSTISYNLACYACQLGNRKEAFQWLGRRLTFRVKRKSGS